MKKVAVTGGLSTGKSTVCRLFRDLGASVVSADTIAHELLESQLKNEIVDLLGEDITSHGQIDRTKVADKVFTDSNLLQQFEQLVQPAIYERIEEAYRQAKAPLFIAEVPLLFEAGWEDRFDATLLVDAPREVRLSRYLEKGHTKEDFNRRESRFQPARTKQTHYVIHNGGTLAKLREKVIQINEELAKAHG